MGAPQVGGQLDLQNFGAEVPQVAMVLRDTELHISGSGASPLKIDGIAHSGKGQLNIDGELNPMTQFFNLNIKGEEFVVADSNQLQAVITPDLQVAMNQEGMQVKGKVTIPRAFVNANGGSSDIDTVAGSGDVVIVDEEGQRQGRSASNNLNLDVY